MQALRFGHTLSLSRTKIIILGLALVAVLGAFAAACSARGDNSESSGDELNQNSGERRSIRGVEH